MQANFRSWISERQMIWRAHREFSRRILALPNDFLAVA
jgi:hypothetical protein